MQGRTSLDFHAHFYGAKLGEQAYRNRAVT